MSYELWVLTGSGDGSSSPDLSINPLNLQQNFSFSFYNRSSFCSIYLQSIATLDYGRSTVYNRSSFCSIYLQSIATLDYGRSTVLRVGYNVKTKVFISTFLDLGMKGPIIVKAKLKNLGLQ